MVNSFYHIRPEQAEKIIKSAKDNKQSILI